MTWFSPYKQSDNTVDIYTYSEFAQVYPTWAVPYPTGLNLNNYTRNQTVIINGVGVTYSVDFSGATNSPRLLGTNGGMYCDNNQCKVGCPSWPYCKAFFHYASVGCQQLDDGCACLTNNNIGTVLTNFAPDGGIRYPSRLIDPMDSSKAKFWNDPNLWYNVFSNGMVLIKNDGPAYGEPGGEEYLITVGHPLTIQPCANESTFGFFDSYTNSITYRQFLCPCVAWNLPHTVHAVNLGTGDACGISDQDPLYNAFGNDQYRLWVMKPDQTPIPDSITRHKVLLGSFPNNQMSDTTGWPVYDLDSHMRVSKYLTYRKPNGNTGYVPDRTEDTSIISYGGIRSYYVSSFEGQGDDGHPSFTITQDSNPETIFIGWNYLDTETRSKNTPTVCGPVNSPEAALLYYTIDDGKNINVNEDCDPGVFNPSSISGYVEGLFSTDPAELGTGKYFGDAARYVLYTLTQPMLISNGKPKIVFYQFPGELNTPDVPFLGSITEYDNKYPLKNSPYLSRESINNVFENSNIVAFSEQKMLQAAELNELQEKFYKNQSLTTKFYNKWFTKNNLTQNATDILGTSGINFKLNPNSLFIDPLVGANTTTPLNPSSITIFKSPENIYTITINADYYRLVSNYGGVDYDIVRGFLADGTRINTIDYINILENKNTSINLNDMTEDQICFINVTIDYGNIITCNEYDKLKDNSGGSTNAPCGASRNLLRIVDPIISDLILKSTIAISSDIIVRNSSPVFNAASETLPPKYLLAYAKKENGVITFYHSNGIKIQ
jgi:hypothetical protein